VPAPVPQAVPQAVPAPASQDLPQAVPAPASQEASVGSPPPATSQALPPPATGKAIPGGYQEPKPGAKLQSQGFRGKKVRHEDGQTYSSDWGDEYGHPDEHPLTWREFKL
jgi:hypothetical protein